MRFGIDIGTTSVSGVALSDSGEFLSSVTERHNADLPGLQLGCFEQDPIRLKATAESVIARLEQRHGKPERIGWTGQMHGVVGVDAVFRPVTNFVTWRDQRRYGGRVMSDWYSQGLPIHRCLPICAFVKGKAEIDATFLHSWYLDEDGLNYPSSWLPRSVEGSMLGDNQAGVRAAQALMPGCAVVNLGTSGQLSVVRDRPFSGLALPGKAAADGSRTELRPYPGGRTLECRASTVGGAAWAALHDELGISWDEMNDSTDSRVVACANRIVDDLFGEVDLTGITGIVGIGNALTRNPALVRALEARSNLPCKIPELPEMAACGAAEMEVRA